MAVNDAEHQLNLEISENEIRKDFSKKERIDYARRLERIERVKAEQRIRATQNNNSAKAATENFPWQENEGEVRNIVAEKVGIGSGKQYEKEKFVADNADPETLAKWDVGDISTHAVYIKIKKEKEDIEKRLQFFEEQKVNEIESIKAEYETKLLNVTIDPNETVDELIESIRKHGVLSPLVVTENNYGKEIIEGVTQKQMQEYVDKIRELILIFYKI